MFFITRQQFTSLMKSAPSVLSLQKRTVASLHTPPQFRKPTKAEQEKKTVRYLVVSGILLGAAYFVPWTAWRDRIFYPEDDDDDDDD
eukprot:CAMPEP_0168559524 /NCGR_PEP_ID=MMETSP0413-20121227/10571_1 /TAXON_ID=136452 /ORGANISM="Filamoeba nolandi, Strain NC-AS-23-1" /LENGTH=86 /DNA_ID=CAMNT_0008590761 /DNA_START=69 /DNA_END=329 /DNA_ORIENTATION=-